jgi:hypothetical protein
LHTGDLSISNQGTRKPTPTSKNNYQIYAQNLLGRTRCIDHLHRRNGSDPGTSRRIARERNVQCLAGDLNALLVPAPNGHDGHFRSLTAPDSCLERISMAQKTQFVCPVHQCRFAYLCDFPYAGTIMQQQYVHVLQNHRTAVWYLVSAIPKCQERDLQGPAEQHSQSVNTHSTSWLSALHRWWVSECALAVDRAGTGSKSVARSRRGIFDSQESFAIRSYSSKASDRCLSTAPSTCRPI